MSDLQVLWAVLVGLYLWECLCWLPRGSVAFTSRFGRKWQMREPAASLSNRRGGFILSTVLPPLGFLLVSHIPPRAIGRRAVQERTQAFESPYAASLDVTTIRKRWAQFQEVSRSLKWWCNGLCVFVFMVTPLAIRFLGLPRCWPALLLCLVAIAFATARTFKRAHRALYPDRAEERFTQSLTIFLAPTSAMRAFDTLSRPLLNMFHPLAIARVFCSPAQFNALAQATLLGLRYAPQGKGHAASLETTAEQQFRQGWLKAVEAFLGREKVNIEDLTRPPEPQDESCHSFCPRCRAQFVWSSGECADCGGLPLQQLARTAGFSSVADASRDASSKLSAEREARIG